MAVAVVAVLLFETLGALAAKRWGFRYGNLTAPMWVLYLLLGLFVQVALLDVRLTVTVAAVAAVVEATAGWAIAARIGPGRLEASGARIAAGLALTVATDTAAALCGATWLLYGIAWALLRVRG
jgi:Na+/H+ antiporter NhaA